MKFQVKVKDFLEGLKPALVASTDSVIKDYKNSLCITIDVKKDHINTIADGGALKVSNILNNTYYSNLYLNIEKTGKCTVDAKSLEKVIKSFNNNDLIVIELSKSDGEDESSSNELLIKLASDEEQFQTLPVLSFNIKDDISSLKNNVNNSFKILKESFCDSADEILFAHGFQEYNEMFLYWVLRLSKERARFVSGCGQRFACVELNSEFIHDSDKNANVIIPNRQTKPLLNILSNYFYSENNKYMNILSSDNCLIFEYHGINICLSLINSNIDWPNENIFLERDSKIKFTIKVKDMDMAMQGIMATYDDSMKRQNDIHVTKIDIDPKDKDKIMHVKAEENLRSSRKIALSDIDISNEEIDRIDLSYISVYLNEALKNAEKEDFIQFEIDSASSMDNPVVIRYFSNSNVTNKEDCCIDVEFDMDESDKNHNFKKRKSVFFASYRK